MVVPAFQGTSVPWVQAQPCRCTRCSTQPRCTTRWGIGLPVPAPTPPHSPRAGPAGHRRGATGGGFGLARPVDGPPETGLGLRPRPVKRLDPEGESNCGGSAYSVLVDTPQGLQPHGFSRPAGDGVRSG